MKNFFKVPTITALGGMVLCAAVVSASANRFASADNAFKGDAVLSSSTNEYAAADSESFENDIFEDVNVTYVGLLDPKENPREYPEEFLPYIEEFEHINAEYGKEYDYYHLTNEAIDRILSMSVEEFREQLCGSEKESVTKAVGQIVAPDGTVYSWDEIVFLTEDEYPDELMPYVEELQHINEEFETDFEFAIMDFMVDECIDEYCSMTIDEFREYIFNAFPREITSATLVNKSEAGQDTHYYADGGTIGVEETKGFGGAVKQRGGYWYFADNETDRSSADDEAVAPDIHYYPDDKADGGIVGVTPHGELYPDDNDGVLAHDEHMYDTDEAHDNYWYSTDEATDPRIGIYQGDGWVYHVYRRD